MQGPPKTLFFLLFLLFALAAHVSAQPRRALTLNVRDFGAVRDGKTKETAALQRALDRCRALGGCEVRVPAPSKAYQLH